MYTEAIMAIQWQSAQATFELWSEINPNPAHWLSVWQAFSQNEWSEPVTLRKKKTYLYLLPQSDFILSLSCKTTSFGAVLKKQNPKKTL